MTIEMLRLDMPPKRKKRCRACKKEFVGHFARVYCSDECKRSKHAVKRMLKP